MRAPLGSVAFSWLFALVAPAFAAAQEGATPRYVFTSEPALPVLFGAR
jgi:hypothetical protein